MWGWTARRCISFQIRCLNPNAFAEQFLFYVHKHQITDHQYTVLASDKSRRGQEVRLISHITPQNCCLPKCDPGATHFTRMKTIEYCSTHAPESELERNAIILKEEINPHWMATLHNHRVHRATFMLVSAQKNDNLREWISELLHTRFCGCSYHSSLK